MAEIISTINKSGADYATLTLWEAAKQGDLVAAGNIETAECYDDSGVLTDALTIDGSTTDASNYMKITVPSGDRHSGTLSAGTSGTGFRLNVTSGNNNGIVCSDPYVIVEWVQIYKSATADYGNSCISNAYIIRNCILVGTGATYSTSGIAASSSNASNGYSANNIIYDHYRSGAAGNTSGIYSDNITYALYNNTVHNCTWGIYPEGHGGTAVTAKNNLVNGSGTQDYYTAAGGFSTTSNNISEDTSSPNVSYRSKAVTFVNEAGDDFHLANSDTNAIDAGTDLGTSPSGVQFDIDGYDRDTGGVTWDIGADEYVPSGTNVTVSVSALTVTGSLLKSSAGLPMYFYNRFKRNLLSGYADFSGSGSHQIKLALLSDSYTYNADHNTFGEISSNEVSGANYTAGGEVLASMTVSKDNTNDFSVFDANDITWASATFTARYAVLYDNTLVTKDLISVIDFGSNLSVNTGTFTIRWESLGIFSVV